MKKDAGWYDDPTLEGRNRYWSGTTWTSHVCDPGGEQYKEHFLGVGQNRWQYGVVNIGMYKAASRMQTVLGFLGSEGWELVGIYDKQSNWSFGTEKGFILMKRPVPPGVTIPEDEWCMSLGITASTKGL